MEDGIGNLENSSTNSCLQTNPPPLTNSSIDHNFMWAQNNNNCNTSSQQTLFDPNNNVVSSGFASGYNPVTSNNYIAGVAARSNRNDNINSDLSLVERKKRQWTVEEDRKLIELVEKYGFRKWARIAYHMTGRIGKQCRERWQNHLRPDIKKKNWTEEEERLLIEAHKRVGNKWAEIAKSIPGRTENTIKNHWNATKRRLTSKRKLIKYSPNGIIKPSVVLEEYIKNKYFNKGGSTSISTPNNNLTPSTNSMSTSYDKELISYLTFESYEEEMDFMKDLFGNNDMAAGSTKMSDVKLPVGSVLATSSEPNMGQNSSVDIIDDAFLHYFCSNMLEGSFGNTHSDATMNQDHIDRGTCNIGD